MDAALANMIDAMPDSPMADDLLKADWLALFGNEPIGAYDRSIGLWEALGRTWGAVRQAAAMVGATEHLPRLARFVAERGPAMLQSGQVAMHGPVSVVVTLADNAMSLAEAALLGRLSTGSKDPFATRRMAKHFIAASVQARLVTS